MSYLPATTYNAPPRSGRGRQLKTIVEAEECAFGLRSDSEGDDSDRTITARPTGLDAKLASAQPTKSKLSATTYITMPSPVASSPCSSIDEGSIQGYQGYSRESYTGSDAGTVFSEDCPSLASSNDTTFYTNSARTSFASNSGHRTSRNRYPSIFIPRDSWQEAAGIKEITLGMSPARKLHLSPQTLSALPQNIPSQHAPPSLGDASSMASNSPCIPAISSMPITPDLQNLAPAQGDNWGEVDGQLDAPIEITLDERSSQLLSPSQSYPQSTRGSTHYSTDWSDIVVRFPEIPGATPQENTPISPNVGMLKRFHMEPSDNGVQLPMDAMDILQHLTRSYSPDSASHTSNTSRPNVEMKERSERGDDDANLADPSPASEYSFSELSIPSPGGFFSSLQASSRATWCLPSQSMAPSMPSSATATNFYGAPFTRNSDPVQTILEVPDRSMTDGPPTARQSNFMPPAEYQQDEITAEDEEFYYSSQRVSQPVVKASSPELGHEYENKYQNELREAAVANIDRTSDWLSAQNTYMSALRECNPRNDPSEYIPQTPRPTFDESEQVEESPAKKAVRFLEDTIGSSQPDSKEGLKVSRESRPRDPVFLEAFAYCAEQKGNQDAFLQAAARIERINSSRLALPVQHVHSLLNICSTETLQMHVRPKYKGPFSQNPRATGSFQRTPEQLIFAEAERKQLAMDNILPAVWMTEALRKVLYKGRLFASPAATNHLRLSITNVKKIFRVLDLAGAATASWGWAAAEAWPNVKFVTVQAKAQSQPTSQWSLSGKKEGSKTVKPTNVKNHRVVEVCQLWKLPFADNHFDIISARTLHMFIRSRPVPEVPSIDEWDLVLKECMRVLKPGGIFDYVLLDSQIANNSSGNHSKHTRDNSTETAASISPTAAYSQGLMSPALTSTFGPSNNLLNPATFDFGRQLSKNGYDADGGCAKVAQRLASSGFESHKSQWVGLPIGHTGLTHSNVLASYEKFETRAPTPASTHSKSTTTTLQRSKIGSISAANGRSRTPFPPAPRPISEVSTISRIIEQYSNVEAVHGPVGSTSDVSDLAGLLGTMMWEEWLVRHRLEVIESKGRQDKDDSKPFDATFEANNLLHGINDILATGFEKGACFRVTMGSARKPRRSPCKEAATATSTTLKAEERPVVSINTNAGSLKRSKLDTYRARAAQRAQANPSYEGFPADSTPITATTSTPNTGRYYGRGFGTPVNRQGSARKLNIDTQDGSAPSYNSPQYTQSAVDRGEVGTIPMMIVE